MPSNPSVSRGGAFACGVVLVSFDPKLPKAGVRQSVVLWMPPDTRKGVELSQEMLTC